MAATAGSDVTDGPVLSVINKRLRALRKKLNRITQMEESMSKGKTLNKEQEEVFRSKPSVTAAIDELEKLQAPIAAAVAEEVNLAVEGCQKPQSVIVEDLLNLLYFGSMFDVKTQTDFAGTMLTRTHERGCCLTYDYVSDDDAAADPLVERDLDLIALMGSLLTSRSVDTNLSHKNALNKCVDHAKLWLMGANQPIEPHSAVTYSGLREKLAKIMSSPYFTTSPEMKAPVEVVTAGGGNFGSFQAQVEDLDVQYQHKDDDAANFEVNESYNNQYTPVEEEPHKVEYEVENSSEVAAQSESAPMPQAEGEQNFDDEQGFEEVKPREKHNNSRRQYQNQRGGRGGYSNGGRGGRNGGSRGGGAYQNGHGRGSYHDRSGNHFPRNYHNNRGRGGSRGSGGNSNNHGVVAPAE